MRRIRIRLIAGLKRCATQERETAALRPLEALHLQEALPHLTVFPK